MLLVHTSHHSQFRTVVKSLSLLLMPYTIAPTHLPFASL